MFDFNVSDLVSQCLAKTLAGQNVSELTCFVPGERKTLTQSISHCAVLVHFAPCRRSAIGSPQIFFKIIPANIYPVAGTP